MVLKRKKAPYADTAVEPHKSRMQIEKMLREFGIEGVQWTELWARNIVEVRFVLEESGKRPIMVKLQPPPFAVPRKTWNQAGHYETVDAPNWAQSYRLLYYYLRAKLQAVAWGLRDIEEEFLSDVVVYNPETQQETTVGEMAQQMMAAGKMQPMLPPGTEAIPQADAKRRAVDAEYRAT